MAIQMVEILRVDTGLFLSSCCLCLMFCVKKPSPETSEDALAAAPLLRV